MYSKIITIFLGLVLASSVYAHELTPTYPEFRSSYMDGVGSVSLTLFNRRNDVSYYQIDAYDEEWNEIEFASSYKIVEIEYLQRKTFEVFMRYSDKPKYVCTTSKIQKGNETATVISSRICSKIK